MNCEKLGINSSSVLKRWGGGWGGGDFGMVAPKLILIAVFTAAVADAAF